MNSKIMSFITIEGEVKNCVYAEGIREDGTKWLNIKFDIVTDNKNKYPCIDWDKRISNGMKVRLKIKKQIHEGNEQYKVCSLFDIIEGDFDEEKINKKQNREDVNGKIYEYKSGGKGTKCPDTFKLVTKIKEYKCKTWNYVLCDGMIIDVQIYNQERDGYYRIKEINKIVDFPFESELNLTEKDYIKKFKNILKIKGVGNATYKKLYNIIKKYGNIEQVIQKIHTDKEIFKKVYNKILDGNTRLKKIKPENLIQLSKYWEQNSKNFYLQCLGLPKKFLNNITYKQNIYFKQLLETNPWKIYKIPVNTCIKICKYKKIKVTGDDIRIAKKAREMYHDYNKNRNTRTKCKSDDVEHYNKHQQLYENHGLYMLDNYLTFKNIYDSEHELVKLLNECNESIEGINTNLEQLDDKNIAGLRKLDKKPKLNEEQDSILKNIFKHPISLIHGGPGTGKSFLTSLLAYVLLQNNCKVQCCAYTGKAVSELRNKLSQFIGHDNANNITKTIHSIIRQNGYYEKDFNNFDLFQYNEDEDNFRYGYNICFPKKQFVFVDEFTMIDGQLFLNFLKSYRKNNIQINLIFIGDTEQLPPFNGWGNIFQNLIDSNQYQKFELKEIRRTNNKDLIIKLNKLRNNEIQYIEHFTSKNIEHSPGDINKVFDIYKKIYNGNNQDKIQIITYKNKTSKQINEQIQKYLVSFQNQELSNKCYNVGERIMCCENDYSVDVMNGETGKIISIEEGILLEFMENKCFKFLSLDDLFEKISKHSKNKLLDELENCICPNLKNILYELRTKYFQNLNKISYIYIYGVEFGRKNIEIIQILLNDTKKIYKLLQKIPGDKKYKNLKFIDIYDGRQHYKSIDKNKYKLGYSITGHKSQGSEYNNVLVYIDNPYMITKKWLYTVATRTKSKLYIICKSDDFHNILKKKTPIPNNWFPDLISNKYIVHSSVYSNLEENFSDIFKNYSHSSVKMISIQKEVQNKQNQRYDFVLLFTDFMNSRYNLYIELDGSQHFLCSSYQKELDIQKEDTIIRQKKNLIRFSNLDNIDSVYDVITHTLDLMFQGFQILFRINYQNLNSDFKYKIDVSSHQKTISFNNLNDFLYFNK